MRKIKNFVLKTITFFMVIQMFVSICCLDGETWLPVYTLLLSWAWLIPFGFVNGFIGRE